MNEEYCLDLEHMEILVFAALLSTASSHIRLNGIAEKPILHGRGLRRGDPLSLLLFVLAIDPLSQLLACATHHGLLHSLGGRSTIPRSSLYANDVAVFVAPIKEDIRNLATILQSFVEVTDLFTNFQKSFVVPIRCASINLNDILDRGHSGDKSLFPLRYLGLPLSVWHLKRVDFQHLKEKRAGTLPYWEGKYITTVGCTCLIKSVITSQEPTT
jgi:hypothetical protein